MAGCGISDGDEDGAANRCDVGRGEEETLRVVGAGLRVSAVIGKLRVEVGWPKPHRRGRQRGWLPGRSVAGEGKEKT
jgi:hypothetical protein